MTTRNHDYISTVKIGFEKSGTKTVNLRKKLPVIMMVCALFGAHPGTLFAQSSFYFSAPLNGYQEIPFTDEAGNAPGDIGPGNQNDANFGTVNGTVLYNPSASTVEMQGNVALNYSSSLTFSDPHSNNGNNTPASVSINYTVGNVNNGVLSFDTGPVNVGDGMSVPIPVSGTYALTTGGQTYNGAFSYTLMLNTSFQIQSVNESSMTFTMDDLLSHGGGHMRNPLADVNAANGVEMALYAEDHSDGVSYYNWQMNNVTALAPEPGTLTLLSVGAAGLLMSLRRRTK